METRIRAILVNSAMAGLSVTFLFWGGVNFVSSITDYTNNAQLKDLCREFVLFLIPALLIFAGSTWQFFLAGFLRKMITENLKKKTGIDRKGDSETAG
ncbi:MAG: hypothetical protein AAGU75_16390 [Bacillota bacterium]